MEQPQEQGQVQTEDEKPIATVHETIMALHGALRQLTTTHRLDNGTLIGALRQHTMAVEIQMEDALRADLADIKMKQMAAVMNSLRPAQPN